MNKGKGAHGKMDARLRERILLIFISVLVLTLRIDQTMAQDEASPLDTRIGLYFNYYLDRYTNTPLLIRRDCTCQLGYQTGIGIQKRFFSRAWLNLHPYVLGGTPGAGESHEQFGVRMEGQYRFDRVTLLMGVHNEWNVDRPSNFPTTSRNGNDIGTDGLRETYVGITWWIK